MKSISERMKEALEIREMKQAELVEKTGIGKSSISTYLSGSYEPKQRNIYKIAQALDVSETWLMGYDVPMERSSSPQVNDNSLLIRALLNSDDDEDSSLYKGFISKKLTQDIDFEPIDIKLLSEFKKLNKNGKNEAVCRVTELTYIPQYVCENPTIVEKKKYTPTEEDIRSLVARNGKKMTREEAIEFITTMFEDEDEE